MSSDPVGKDAAALGLLLLEKSGCTATAGAEIQAAEREAAKLLQVLSGLRDRVTQLKGADEAASHRLKQVRDEMTDLSEAGRKQEEENAGLRHEIEQLVEERDGLRESGRKESAELSEHIFSQSGELRELFFRMSALEEDAEEETSGADAGDCQSLPI